MRNELIEQKPKRVYILVILIWVVLVAILTTIIVQSNINSERNAFNANTMSLYHSVSDQLKTNETVVEGFSASVGAIGEIDRNKIRIFSQQMLKRYPHIFMFEIAEKVAAGQKGIFEQKFRTKILPGFTIREFGYETDRTWREAKEKEFYLPITFMEPFPPESRKVLGLDLNSNQFFIKSLKKSSELQIPVVTEPFKLVEGDLAYLIHRPILKKELRNIDLKHGVSDRYVMLVILAKSLFQDQIEKYPDYGITLYHSNFGIEDSKGHLYNQKMGEASGLERLIFPELSFSLTLNSKTQPFILSVNHQLGWESLNLWFLIALCITALVSFYVVMNYAKVYHLSEVSRIEETDHLFYLANHDSLTGLANRNLLMDRLRHAISQASRNKSKLAVLFIDIDGFKPVNDTYGHDIGDKLLRRASERLLASIRSGDTLARRSGDEFIAILENVDNVKNVEYVTSKIGQAFEQEFHIDGQNVSVGVSIGYAIYPDDAEVEDELLVISDKRMYENKK